MIHRFSNLLFVPPQKIMFEYFKQFPCIFLRLKHFLCWPLVYTFNHKLSYCIILQYKQYTNVKVLFINYPFNGWHLGCCCCYIPRHLEEHPLRNRTEKNRQFFIVLNGNVKFYGNKLTLSVICAKKRKKLENICCFFVLLLHYYRH